MSLSIQRLRVSVSAMLFTAVVAFFSVGVVSPAYAAETDTIFSSTNSARSTNGLGSLKSNTSLNSVAQTWAQQMAANQSMTHNPNVGSQIPAGWKSYGENVAMGYPTGTATVEGWMNSTGHRANILGSFSDIGVGWFVDGNGVTWAVQVFATYTSTSEPVPSPAPDDPNPTPVPVPDPGTPTEPPVTAEPIPEESGGGSDPSLGGDEPVSSDGEDIYTTQDGDNPDEQSLDGSGDPEAAKDNAAATAYIVPVTITALVLAILSALTLMWFKVPAFKAFFTRS